MSTYPADSLATLYLNGKPVQQANLRDRDQIKAGQTVIEIRLEDISQIRKQVLAYLKRQARPFFAIFDLAQDKSIYPLLQRYPDTLRQNLFAGKQGQQVETQAPHLVQFTAADDVLLEQLVMQGWGNNWGVYLFAPLSFEEVRQHIRQCMRVKIRKEYMLFRFYDPRVFVDIISKFDLQQLKEFFGPIHTYLLEDEDSKKMLKSQITNHQAKTQPEEKNKNPLNALSE